MEAYILVKISTQSELHGHAQSVTEKLRTIKGVEDAQLLFGDCDVIVKLNVAKIHDVENCVIEGISMTEGVESTITLLCVDEETLE